MRIFRSLAEVPDDFGPSAVTVGKFDGVHAGHRAVIRELETIAARDGLPTVVITFDRHPLEQLAPEKAPPALVGVDQKLDLLAATGIDACLLLTFDSERAAQTAEAFVDEVLVGKLHAREVLIGDDFRFGFSGSGDAELLDRLGPSRGFRVTRVDDVMPDGATRVSSTWIRRLLADGDVARAAGLLGHPPSVRGTVVHGAKRGRELGYPTANLSPESVGLIPADGVYAGWLDVDGERYPAAISVGNNPTFEGVPQKQVEAYVLDRDIDLYDRIVDVSFVARIRGMVAFEGIEALIRQIADDVVATRALLDADAEPSGSQTASVTADEVRPNR